MLNARLAQPGGNFGFSSRGNLNAKRNERAPLKGLSTSPRSDASRTSRGAVPCRISLGYPKFSKTESAWHVFEEFLIPNGAKLSIMRIIEGNHEGKGLSFSTYQSVRVELGRQFEKGRQRRVCSGNQAVPRPAQRNIICARCRIISHSEHLLGKKQSWQLPIRLVTAAHVRSNQNLHVDRAFQLNTLTTLPVSKQRSC